MKIAANTNQCDNRTSAAFTITEAVVAAGLFAIVFLAAYWGIVQGDKLIENTRENERATQILLDKAEVLRLYTWDELTNIAFTPLSFSESYNASGTTNNNGAVTDGNEALTYYGSVTIGSAPLTETYSNDMRLLTFQLNWTNNYLNHQRQFTTLVSRYGEHNYIYGPTN
jgi:hypothetical protein